MASTRMTKEDARKLVQYGILTNFNSDSVDVLVKDGEKCSVYW